MSCNKNFVCFLRKTVKKPNERGSYDNVTEERLVFCAKKSIYSNEHYSAATLGIQLAMVLIIDPYEYNNEEEVVFEDKKYLIERTYRKNDRELELVLKTTTVLQGGDI